MADIVGPKIEVIIQFEVRAVILSDAVEATGCFVTLDGQGDWGPTTVPTFQGRYLTTTFLVILYCV